MPFNSSETDTTAITIGHLDEVHCVSTVPFNEQAMAFNVICNNQPLQLAMGCCRTTNNNETIAVAKEQKRKAYLKEYMATRGRNIEFRISKTELCKERDQKILKKQDNLKGGHLIDAKNRIHVRELNRQAFAKSKKSNTLQVRMH